MNPHIEKIISEYVKFPRGYHKEYYRQTMCIPCGIDIVMLYNHRGENVKFVYKMDGGGGWVIRVKNLFS